MGKKKWRMPRSKKPRLEGAVAAASSRPEHLKSLSNNVVASIGDDTLNISAASSPMLISWVREYANGGGKRQRRQ